MTTPSKAAQIRWLLSQGLPRKDVAREVGCDLRYVSVVVQRNGGSRPCDVRASRRRREKRREWMRLYKQRPDVRARERARHAERMASDPEYAARRRERWRRENERKKQRKRQQQEGASP